MEARSPFLDHKLFEYAATLHDDAKLNKWTSKYSLRQIARQLLPKEVIDHRKQGFIGPMTQWLKHDLKTYTLETLTKKNLTKHDFLDHHTLLVQQL